VISPANFSVAVSRLVATSSSPNRVFTGSGILENHNYPLPVKTLLGELLVATSLLTATLKFAGDQLAAHGELFKQIAV
jgi:redox-regulated HSP33 family molecular chaperone